VTTDTQNVKLTAHPTSVHQEVRVTLNGGGPGGIELIAHADEDGASIAIWNPFRNEWARVNLVSLGSTR
jgi:NADH dehydrogenase FAD-containing subunit